MSPSLAGVERDDCAALAAEWGLAWSAVETDEMARAAYRRNDADRCFHCKAELMDAVAPVAAAAGGATVVLGVNVDDLDDHRPGQEAARQAGARFPLVDAGFTKAEVREASRRLGLRTWDKPAAACLASRVPHGTEVTVAVLSRVERAEAALRALGFDGDLRVRHHGDPPGSRWRRRPSRHWSPPAPRSLPPCTASGTATSPSISTASAPAASTPPDTRMGGLGLRGSAVVSSPP